MSDYDKQHKSTTWLEVLIAVVLAIALAVVVCPVMETFFK